MKETYGCPSKALARKELHDFIKESYPVTTQRANLRVLTLLGHEDHELRQIWDPLGFKRANITTLDKDPAVIKKLLQMNLGINIHEVPTTIDSFLENEGGRYDIINIDETSQFGYPQREAIRSIAHRGLLGNMGILATWYLSRREAHYTKHWFDKISEEQGSKTGLKERSDLISRMICGIMMDGMTTYSPHPLARFVQEEYDREYGELRAKVEQVGGESDKVLHCIISDKIIRPYLEKCVKEQYPTMSEDSCTWAADLLYYQDIGAYFSQAQKRFYYVSDNGSPMSLDLNLFSRPLPENVRWCDYGHLKIEVMKASKATLFKAADRFNEVRMRATGASLAQRHFLGSSFVKPEKLSRDDALMLLKSGVPSEEILEAFPKSYTKMQLAAFKAHLTMGTYEKRVV